MNEQLAPERREPALELNNVGAIEYRTFTLDKRPNKIRELNIKQLSTGYVVSVGCQSFAFTTKEDMTVKLLEYINAPAATEEKFYKEQQS